MEARAAALESSIDQVLGLLTSGVRAPATEAEVAQKDPENDEPELVTVKRLNKQAKSMHIQKS